MEYIRKHKIVKAARVQIERSTSVLPTYLALRVEGINDVADEGEVVVPDRSVKGDRLIWVSSGMGLRRSGTDEGNIKAAVADLVRRMLELKEFSALDELTLFGSGHGKDAIFVDIARTARLDFDKNQIAIRV